MTTIYPDWRALALELVDAAREDHGSPPWPAPGFRLFDTMASAAAALRMVAATVNLHDAAATVTELDRLADDVAERRHDGLLDRNRAAIAVKAIELADPALQPGEVYDRSITWALFEADQDAQDFDVIRTVMPLVRSVLQDVPDRQGVLDRIRAKAAPSNQPKGTTE